MTPVPAARTSIPRPVKSATALANEGQVVDSKVLRDHRETSSNRKLSYCSSSSESDDLALDDQCLDMFSSRNELNQTANAQRAVDAVGKRHEQLQSIHGTEAECLKLAEQSKKLEQENLTRQNGTILATMDQPTVSPPEVEHTKRKKLDRSPQSQVNRLAEKTESSDDEIKLKIPVPPNRRPRVPSAAAMSRTSSVSEFFSLSEAESDSPVQETKEFRQPEENEDDPDASFAAMCAALARRKQRDDPVIPNDVSLVPMLGSADQTDSSSSSPSGDSINDGEFWQRPNIEPGWITEKSHSVSSSPRSASPAPRRSSSLNDVQGDSILFPLLSNSSFSAVL